MSLSSRSRPSGEVNTAQTLNDNVLYAVRKLHKEFRMEGLSVPVLRGCELDVHKGEILAVVGLSGVGKSTLLNIMGLLDTPSAGTLVYNGRDESFRGGDLADLGLESKCRMRNRHFGFVFQFYHLLPDLTVLENVLLPAMILRTTKRFRSERTTLTERARDLLGRVGVLDRADFPSGRLSGGERQRVAIARSLMNDPELVFCDEPTGNLDTVTGDKIHELLVELNRELQTAFVIVTHDIGLARLAHRTLTMRDGLFVKE